MRLYYTPTSPYVRKVLIVAHECGLSNRIETILIRPVPMQAEPTVSLSNPLSKVPVLLLPDETSLYDSPVICEYLDSLHDRPKIIPPVGPARWSALRTAALADGVADACFLLFYEQRRRPPALQWAEWIAGHTEKAIQGLDALDAQAETFSEQVDIGQICAASVIGWMEFRNLIGDIRSDRPSLFRWYDAFKERPSMKATAPHD